MLTRLDAHAIRNLEAVRLSDIGRVSILYGLNGSGKTSLLEAIHMLAMARSFRASSARSVISHGRSACTVYGEVARGPASGVLGLGVQRERSGLATLKVGGQVVRTVSSLVAALPVRVINADSFQLLLGPPGGRRQFLDWGAFHVEQEFFDAWKRFQRCIKQRNALLRRDRLIHKEVAAWTRDLAAAGEVLSGYRRRYFERLVPAFHDVAAALLPECPGIVLRYRRGWDESLSYAEALASTTATDREQGYTHVGPQRADVVVTADGHGAAETLSRGQQKLVVCALTLAQGLVLGGSGRPMRCTYLIDDLPSELDAVHVRRVCEQLERIGGQVFVTCIDPGAMSGLWPATNEPPRLFHVEQGRVMPASPTITTSSENTS